MKKRRKLAVFSAVLTATGLADCSFDTSSAYRYPSATSKSLPEYQLAVLDSNGALSDSQSTDSLVLAYRDHLDFLSRKTGESPASIADITSRCVEVGNKRGYKVNNLGFLAEMKKFYSEMRSEDGKASYREAATLQLTLNTTLR